MTDDLATLAKAIRLQLGLGESPAELESEAAALLALAREGRSEAAMRYAISKLQLTRSGGVDDAQCRRVAALVMMLASQPM